MRIAIIGAGGQLGQDLRTVLAEEDVLPFARSHIDLTKPDSIAACLKDAKPDVVINCAAYNFVDKAEDEPEAAFAVNALGVRALVCVCADIQCDLFHVSTDYVFGRDTTRQAPYREDDAPEPVSVYGASKLAGEHFVRALGPTHCVIRTCGLYGRKGQGGKGGNFVETILKRGRAGVPLRVVDDQHCTPTATTDLARAITRLVRLRAEGLFHVTNSGSCSWFEFAKTILKLAGLKTELAPIASAEFGAKARRPRYSVLDTWAFSRACPEGMRPWRAALAEYLAR